MVQAPWWKQVVLTLSWSVRVQFRVVPMPQVHHHNFSKSESLLVSSPACRSPAHVLLEYSVVGASSSPPLLLSTLPVPTWQFTNYQIPGRPLSSSYEHEHSVLGSDKAR